MISSKGVEGPTKQLIFYLGSLLVTFLLNQLPLNLHLEIIVGKIFSFLSINLSARCIIWQDSTTLTRYLIGLVDRLLQEL